MAKFQPLYLSSTYVSSNVLYLSAISSSPYIYFVASQYIVASSSQKHVSQLKLTRDALASHNHKKDKLDESKMPPVSFWNWWSLFYHGQATCNLHYSLSLYRHVNCQGNNYCVREWPHGKTTTTISTTIANGNNSWQRSAANRSQQPTANSRQQYLTSTNNFEFSMITWEHCRACIASTHVFHFSPFGTSMSFLSVLLRARDKLFAIVHAATIALLIVSVSVAP